MWTKKELEEAMIPILTAYELSGCHYSIQSFADKKKMSDDAGMLFYFGKGESHVLVLVNLLANSFYIWGKSRRASPYEAFHITVCEELDYIINGR